MSGWYEGFEPYDQGNIFKGCVLAGCFTAGLIVVVLLIVGVI